MKKPKQLIWALANGSWSNWSLWRLAPRHRNHLDTVSLANHLAKYPNKPNQDNIRKTNILKKHNQKNQATLVDPARKRSGLLYTGPGTTRARLPASRFARFLSPARGRRQHRTVFLTLFFFNFLNFMLNHVNDWLYCISCLVCYKVEELRYDAKLPHVFLTFSFGVFMQKRQNRAWEQKNLCGNKISTGR